MNKAKVILLQQVDMVTHLCEKLLGFSVFLNVKDMQIIKIKKTTKATPELTAQTKKEEILHQVHTQTERHPIR